MAQPIPLPTANWLHDFPNMKFSSLEFYDNVESELNNRGIPNAKYTRITLNQTGIFSSKREYLRVVKGELTFDICAAPYGSGFFVSWWYGERASFFKALIYRIPFIGVFFMKVSQFKTYYQWDTEAMFREAVRSCINESVRKITTTQGVKGLSDFELQFVERKK